MFIHDAVLKHEAIKGLNIKPNGVYVDCTVGGGGHAEKILQKLENGHLIAFDQDREALNAAQKKLKKFTNKTTFIHANFRNLQEELWKRDLSTVDGILFDLGVSSPQFDEGERGFSYRFDATLDMRMNQKQPLTAYEIVNEWPYEQLVAIFFRYGEERFSKQIARRIERIRKTEEIKTTFQLVEIIKNSIPARSRRTGGHPARRIFQALRIAVNDELASFREALQQAAKVTKIKGRIAVITFHSLEDRICQQSFRKWSTRKDVPRNLPIIPEGFEAPFRIITRKPIMASQEEINKNRRSRSARLRIVEKVSKWDDDFSI